MIKLYEYARKYNMGGNSHENFFICFRSNFRVNSCWFNINAKSKADALSGLIQGSKSETFFTKNKSKTKEAMLAKVTIVSMLLFAINTIALNLI